MSIRIAGIVSALGALALVLAVVIATGALAGGSSAPGPVAARISANSSGDDGDEPSQADEGIKVHGDWVIEVKNPDGSLAERREFENALQPGGKVFLRNTLARQASPGVWGIRLPHDGIGPSPCGVAEPTCVIREPITSALDNIDGTHFPTLTVSSPGGPPIEIVLQGNFDAVADGSIESVESIQCFSQPPSVDPGVCNNVGFTITATTLQTPVEVLAGQQVLVTVRISFS